jgi:hypothetical protein
LQVARRFVIIDKLDAMNEKFLQCFPNAPQATVDEVITWQHEQAENERAWRIEKERRRTALRSFAAEAERQLHDPHRIRAHPNRLLWRASKGLEAFKRALSRDGRDPAPSRKDKQRMRTNLRKRARQLEILTERGEKSAPSQGIRRQRFTTVVAAT